MSQVKKPNDILTDQDALAKAIVAISTAAVKLAATGLNRKAVVVLLADSTGLAKRTITAVLDGLEDLKQAYCR